MAAGAAAADDDIEELKGAVMKTLEAKGVLQKIRAELRASVFTAVKQGVGEPAQSSAPCGGNSEPAGLLRDLMQEYFSFYNLDYSRDVFACEAGCPALASGGAQREQLRVRAGLGTRREGQPAMPMLAELLQGGFQAERGDAAGEAASGSDNSAGNSSLLGELPGLPGLGGAPGPAAAADIPEEDEDMDNLVSPGNDSAKSYPKMDEYSSYGEDSFDMSAASEALSGVSDGRIASTAGVSIVASDHSADGSGCLESYGVDYMEDFKT